MRLRVPVDDPRFGQAVPCSCVLRETEEKRQRRLQRYSNLGPLTRLTFANLMRRGRSPATRDQERYQRCVEDAEAFAERPEGWLVLTGASGCGKTHIAAAVANRLIERGQPALFVVVPDLLDHLRAAYAPDAELSYDQLFEQVRNAPVLILDDLGTQSATPWAQEKLFQLINHRFNARLPTIVTTNLTLEQFDERLRTRLSDPSLARVWTLEERRPQELRGLDALNLPLFREMTFDRFDHRGLHLPPDQRRALENAYRHALAFAEKPENWLVFMGPHGAGKTHLAAAIANYRRQQGDDVTFVVVPDLLDFLRQSFSADQPATFHQVFESIRTAPVLVLDDLDVQANIPWVREKLFQLLNHRYAARLPTVITTALSMDELGERLASRLVDPTVCAVLYMGSANFHAQPASGAGTGRRGRPRR
ncbi:MAG TPA: ATP-binding protein [Dehalococcoidia bacterium]|nr:ATP-binding protein [Dehalococcoidia bacterium]